ncbi:hypothetical protein [Microbacterium excoecariae]|uniref:hypothetical protein n=1 Tax=Microbacterium excoecariae TaxID=2715210 RepID=UPI00140C28F8|nr:hypothetical protein [Microbacterium excoecariae]NHI16835.1 hypothetical protein [Microbacterium excoecariae]
MSAMKQKYTELAELRADDIVRVRPVSGLRSLINASTIARVLRPIGSRDGLVLQTDDGFTFRADLEAYDVVRVTRLHDDTGLTTGRWRVRRRVLVWRDDRAWSYVWRAEPIGARGVAAHTIASRARDFDPRQHARAVAYAASMARKNLR